MFQSNTQQAETPLRSPDIAQAEKMDPTFKAKWLRALRGGKYTQARNTIGDTNEKHLCCIGVGAAVAKPRRPLATTTFAVGLLSEFGFNEQMAHVLVRMNDGERKSFLEIADYIEANL